MDQHIAFKLIMIIDKLKSIEDRLIRIETKIETKMHTDSKKQEIITIEDSEEEDNDEVENEVILYKTFKAS